MLTVCPLINAFAVTPDTVAVAVPPVLVERMMLPALMGMLVTLKAALIVPLAAVAGLVVIG